MLDQHTLFVCTTCASTWQDGRKIGQSKGEQLLAQLRPLHEAWPLNANFTLQPVQCMSACNRPCTVAFTAPGKHSYLFGDLDPEHERVTELLPAILACAELYYQKPQGLMPWSDRPELMKSGIVARIPPQP